MAYKKRKSNTSKRKSTAGRRRRRVSGIGSNKNLLLIAGAVGGYLASDMVNTKIKTMIGNNADGTPKIDPKILAAVEVLAGFAIPKFLLKNSAAGKVVGGLLMGIGAKEGLKVAGVISGYSDLRMIAGARDMRAIAGVQNSNNNVARKQTPGLSSMQVISGIVNN